LQEISDRPSSYFFSEFASVIHNPPLLKDKTSGGVLISKAKQNAQLHSVDVHPKMLYSADLQSDLVEYVNDRNYDVLILEWVPPQPEISKKPETSIRESMRKSDLRKSAVEIVDKSVGTVESVISSESSSAFASHAISHVECIVGLYVHNQSLKENPKPLQKVLFIYNGTQPEQFALNTILRLPDSVQVTIFVTDPASISGKDLKENMSLVQTDEPRIAGLEEIQRGYDLLIMGKGRTLSELITDPLLHVGVPALVIFPPTRLPVDVESTPEEQQVSHSDELVNLPSEV